MLFPSINAIALAGVAPQERGRVMAVFTGAFNLGFGATWLLGEMAGHTGYPAAFVVAAAVGWTATAGLALSRPLGGRPPRHSAGLAPAVAK